MHNACSIHLVHKDTLSCEPFVRRAPNGELVCVCQCGGKGEPEPENRVYVFHSADNGVTWSKPVSLYPEDGRAVYCTELMLNNGVLCAFLTTHLGHFLDWRCVMMESRDNGYTWENAGPPPYFPTYTFVRSLLKLRDGTMLLPYHTYPVAQEDTERLIREKGPLAQYWELYPPYTESGVLISRDNGRHYERREACRFSMKERWLWPEPTIAQLRDGTIVMLLRKERSGWLWRTESKDGGNTWSEVVCTDIPNPSNKPRLIPLPDGRIVLLHTPNNEGLAEGKDAVRFPYEAWISDDDMKTWRDKRLITNFPGFYSYSDGFYEDGHLLFTVEHNRRDILFLDMEL